MSFRAEVRRTGVRRERSTRGVLFTSALSLLVATSAFAAVSGERELSFDVDKDGLKWTGPCRAVVYHAGERDESVAVALVHGDLTKPASIPAGKYELLVECPSTEGALKQTQPLTVGAHDVTAKVKLRPAFLVVRAVRDGKDVSADVEVEDAFGRSVQKGRDKVALPVPPGKLRVTARVDQAAAGTSRPVLGAVEVTTREGQKEAPVIDTSDGTLVLVLTNNGRPAEGVAALRAPGGLKRLVELPTGEPQPVPPGTYDVVTQLVDGHDFKEQVQRKVRIQPGKTVTLRLAHQTGQVQPELLLGKKPLEGKKAEVQLFVPGAPRAFNTLAADEVATLSPGRYRLLARITDEKLDDGSPWERAVDVTVRKGRTEKARIELLPPTLSLTTSIGNEPASLELEVFREGADVAFLRGKQSPADGKLTLRLPAGGYRVVATKRAPQGPLVTEARVFLKEGQALERTIDLDVGKAVVQVFERGIAVPAEVLFFASGAAAPILGVPAGQDAWLPPGTYALTVRRRGHERTFSPIRVTAGRELERQLELTATDDVAAPAGADDRIQDDSLPDGEPPAGDGDLP